jgi:hypothetical protein
MHADLELAQWDGRLGEAFKLKYAQLAEAATSSRHMKPAGQRRTKG